MSEAEITAEIEALERELVLQRERSRGLPLPLQQARESATAGRIAELQEQIERVNEETR